MGWRDLPDVSRVRSAKKGSRGKLLLLHTGKYPCPLELSWKAYSTGLGKSDNTIVIFSPCAFAVSSYRRLTTQAIKYYSIIRLRVTKFLCNVFANTPHTTPIWRTLPDSTYISHCASTPPKNYYLVGSERKRDAKRFPVFRL